MTIFIKLTFSHQSNILRFANNQSYGSCFYMCSTSYVPSIPSELPLYANQNALAKAEQKTKHQSSQTSFSQSCLLCGIVQSVI